MKIVKLMPDYGCYPLWYYDDTNCFIDNLPLDSDILNISDSLIERLYKWSIDYDNTLNQDYPPDSGFNTEKDLKYFLIEGLSLWNELISELPDFKIIYFSVENYELYEDINNYESKLLAKFSN